MIKLNPAQQQAVEHIEGPVMVIAGPGTGKTQVLATRVAHILEQTDTNPSSILALTFTDNAAHNMRQRLLKIIGKDAYFVKISTFHAFCSDIIQSHPESFPLSNQAQSLTDLEKLQLMENLILSTELEHLKPLKSQLYYLKAIISAISELKRENISPDKLAEIVELETERLNTEKLTKTQQNKLQTLINKNRELIVLYQKYQTQLAQTQRYDFEDMIGLVIEAFDQYPELLLEYQEEIHYFLVDEYQDTNAAQNKVVSQLASFWGEQANLFVVGDPHQSIFRFQGASVENALSFIDHYPQTQIITLATGYRCPQPIYDAAHNLIAANYLTAADKLEPNLNPKRLELINQLNQKLKSGATNSNSGSALTLTVLPDHTSELVWIAEEIKKLHQQGTPYNDMAVLFHNNSEGEELQAVLGKWEIPSHTSTGHNVLKSESVRQLVQLLTLIDQITQPYQDELLYEVLNYQWLGLDSVLIMKAARQAAEQKQSLLEVLKNNDEFKTLQEFVTQLQNWQSLNFNLVFSEFFETLLRQSGFLKFVREQNLTQLLEVNTLYEQIKNWVGHNHHFKLSDFLSNLATMAEQGISLPLVELIQPEQSVTLSTVHSAKGMEWRHVFMVNVVDKHWGNKRQRELLPLPEGLIENTDLSKKEANEDERRLFYVGITRASAELHLSYAQTKTVNFRTKEQEGSMFLQELGVKNDQVTHLAESQINPALVQLLTPVPEQKSLSESEIAFLKQVAQDLVLSPTALNTYLRDPQQFLEKNLLRLPQPPAPHLAFGTAVHAALEATYREILSSNNFLPIDQAQQIFKKVLSVEPLTDEDFQRWLTKGQQVITSYYQHFAQSKPNLMSVEKFLGGNSNLVILDNDIKLSGRIDRIDWLDKDQKTIRVIDYKTGAAKSKKYIDGQLPSMPLSERELALPESIRGPYKRQLLFYKLLTQLAPNFPYQVTQGEFVFVEPTKSGKVTSHQFELETAAVEDLKDLIREVMAEIRELTLFL